MDGAAENLGIIPRTVELLFNKISTASILGWSYTVKASFLEIHNEVLYDLLSNEQKDIEIRMANAKSKTEIYVTNIIEKKVKSAAELYKLMRTARSNRATAATANNDRSTRSHAVTRLEVTGKHVDRAEKLIGFINLVDLAGSESPKTSTRMEETKNINRSLSELSNVIMALVAKNEHIPYRNSKLTHLLMPSLGGNSNNFIKTLRTLNWAFDIKKVQPTKPTKNQQPAQGSSRR
jgi:kinesin family member C1